MDMGRMHAGPGDAVQPVKYDQQVSLPLGYLDAPARLGVVGCSVGMRGKALEVAAADPDAHLQALPGDAPVKPVEGVRPGQ